ncbi:MAG: DUF2029 domain-containing protein [Longispora sp.]|nr:DUF2029 domain-containing protein [Longispora sp. (in: high G+C Gram-positive bacteria)]
MNWLQRIDRAGDGIVVDCVLYACSAIFAWFTIQSTLPAHRPWGAVATFGYAAAAVIAGCQLLARQSRVPSSLHPSSAGTLTSTSARVSVTLGAWVLVGLVPLLLGAVQRAAGRTDRAQEEVLVVEESARRLVEHGTPYLSRTEIATLPDPLLGYDPYQPGMAAFGLPKVLLGEHWFTDARIWFALVTAACLAVALRVGTPAAVRALQALTVIPVAALTLATGGDDLPVLALMVLSLAYLARGRDAAAGLTLGVAASLKLFAWPVAVVVALTRPNRALLIPLLTVPVLTALPPLLVNPGAFVENVLAFPLGHGLVTSPAASPLPGHLLATSVPGGRYIALALLGVTACALGWWVLRRPPRTAAAASTICAVGLLAAMLLMPATRFGYLLYPVTFALWVPYLTSIESRSEDDTTRVGVMNGSGDGWR